MPAIAVSTPPVPLPLRRPESVEEPVPPTATERVEEEMSDCPAVPPMTGTPAVKEVAPVPPTLTASVEDAETTP